MPVIDKIKSIAGFFLKKQCVVMAYCKKVSYEVVGGIIPGLLKLCDMLQFVWSFQLKNFFQQGFLCHIYQGIFSCYFLFRSPVGCRTEEMLERCLIYISMSAQTLM